MSWLDDAAYTWNLGLYQLGIKSTPPIVLPVDSVAGSAELAKEAKEVEEKYSHTANLKYAVTESAKEVGGFLTGTLPLILILLIIIYFIYRKEFKTA